ncbi:MAG: ABC transporter ATP-binding protein [Leptolyngbyaceae bacterium]|nr:ABC transporter ATP-binding protein [Leptolyngbyaceae bacterium]
MILNLKSRFQSPAYQLILAVAKRNWPLLVTNLGTNLGGAILEGSTLGIIYLAIAVLSEGTQSDQHSPVIQRVLLLAPLSDGQLFIGLMGVAVVLQVLLSLSNYTNKLMTAYLSARAQPQVTGQVFKQIMSFSFACASSYKVGDLVMFANDAALTVDKQLQLANNLVVSLSFAAIYSVILVSLSPWLALIAVALAVIILVFQRQVIPRLKRAARQLTLAQVETNKFMTENIQALRLLHTFGTQQRAIDEAIDKLHIVQKRLQKRANLFYLPEPIFEILPILSLATLAIVAYSLKASTESILPLLLTFLLALQRLALRLKVTASVFTQLADNSARMQRLDSILETSDKQFAIGGAEPFDGLHSDICFEDVSLAYGNEQKLALQKISFTIPRHKVTALVGQSGAGKSSIVDLLIGLYQPNLGRISVNGKSLHQYDIESWRQYIGVVSQDTFIFNCSILENLRYGRAHAGVDEVVEAAKAAQAHQFILELPDGYETVVGERGYRLSGGQRQRLALARAIIKQPEVLILDEATSALDSESERLIQETLVEFQKDRTVIVIAHRLSTIMDADQILVFEEGQLVEQGIHRTLISRPGRYAQYWNLQTEKTLA